MNIWRNTVVLALTAAVVLSGGQLIAQQAAPAGNGARGRDLLGGLTPEQAEAMIARSIQARLLMERAQAAAEISRGLLYDEDDIDKALALLNNNPANTQADNIDRICKAFAVVDLRFDKMTMLRAAGKYSAAAAAAKAMLKGQRSTYLSAAQHFMCADSLVQAGKWEDGVDVYVELLTTMPDRISFAAEAAIRAAEAYEKNGRYQNAMKMYTYCVYNYGLTLDKARLADTVAKIEKYNKLYKEPMKTVSDMMGAVQRRLASVDSGEQTQKKEDEIIALLDDLIKTAEEQEQQQSQSQSRQRGRQKNEGQGKGQAKGQGKAAGSGDQPSSPMRDSMLPPGAVKRPPKDLSAIRPTKETGDWAKLPPREKQKIEQIRRNLVSERYRSAISDYHTRMAEGMNKE